VTNSNSPIDWALFGYEGQTNVLKLISKGEDGIEELTEDLNPSKILYAFIKIEDPKTSLPKFVILNWQGETAPGNRKGVCAMHLRDVERFFHGHHLTFNVRNEDEIDIDAITKKVSAITGSAYNFKAKPQGMEHSPEPVGTSHKKINPLQELPKMSEREKFWSKDQDEEKKRIFEERERRIKDSIKTEEERKNREEKENIARESQIKEKEKKILQLREQEKKAEVDRNLEEKALWERQQDEDALAAKERSQRSENMRQERAREAKELIKSRSSDAKKLFTRNLSQGQMNIPREKPVQTLPQNSGQSERSATKYDPQPQLSVRPEASPDPGDSVAANIAPPAEFQVQEGVESRESTSSAGEEVDLHHATPVNLDKEATLESYGQCAVSLYDYQASDETEISFDPGQIITHIDQIDPGWWQGLGPDGSYGLFPANYVEIIDSSELQFQT